MPCTAMLSVLSQIRVHAASVHPIIGFSLHEPVFIQSTIYLDHELPRRQAAFHPAFMRMGRPGHAHHPAMQRHLTTRLPTLTPHRQIGTSKPIPLAATSSTPSPSMKLLPCLVLAALCVAVLAGEDRRLSLLQQESDAQ